MAERAVVYLTAKGGSCVCASFSGVGFSFIFSWVLMGVVTTLFVVGGNVEKLLCEPLANRQLFKVPNVKLRLSAPLPSLCAFWPGFCHRTTLQLCAHEYTRVCL